VITSESRRLERLVADLLDLARLDAREFSMRPAPTDATSVVRGVVDGLAPTALQWDVRLELVDTSATPTEIDPERLAQIVANLVENALKYAATLVRASVAIEDGTLVILVDDDGPGIPEEERSRVFERLYTARGTPSRKVGTGIGLAVVRELTHAMGGQVACEPRGTGGTRFVVRIPAGPADEPGAPRRASGD
jgi:signal transduction histidine kinase